MKFPAVVCAAMCLFDVRTLAAQPAIVVDCAGASPGAFTSLRAALESLDPRQPGRVQISGVCRESVNIDGYHGLTLTGVAGAAVETAGAPGPTLAIRHSTKTRLQDLTVRGGALVDNADVHMHGVTLEGARGPGVLVFANSFLRLTGSSVIDNTTSGLEIVSGATVHVYSSQFRGNRTGIVVDAGALLVEGDVLVERNREAGILGRGGSLRWATFYGPNTIRETNSGVQLIDAASAVFTGPHAISANVAFGVQAAGNSSVRFASIPGSDGEQAGSLIEDNGAFGVNLSGSTASFAGPHRIRKNGWRLSSGGFGIRAGSNSRLQIGGGTEVSDHTGPGVIAEWNSSAFLTGTSVVRDNREEGVRVIRNSIALLNGPISGNGTAPATCDTTGLIVLEADPIPGIRCSRVEREHGPPRPGVVK